MKWLTNIVRPCGLQSFECDADDYVDARLQLEIYTQMHGISNYIHASWVIEPHSDTFKLFFPSEAQQHAADRAIARWRMGE